MFFFVIDEDEVISRRDVMTSRQTVIEVKVPRDAVGVVIGPQGSNIKEVSLMSICKCMNVCMHISKHTHTHNTHVID